MMATKTITVTEDAYERLKACKEDGESFSETITRITSGASLADYIGILDDDTAEAIRSEIAEQRDIQRKLRQERRDRIAETL
jgi:predicted CopG family antitoxin